MKKCVLSFLAALAMLETVGCGGGLEPGFVNNPPTAVIIPPPAEKPANYKVALPPGMHR